MRILFGLHMPDAGEILLDGEPLRCSSPADAIAAGVGMIHQHFMLVPTLTVAENVALGMRSDRGGRRTDLGRVSRADRGRWRSVRACEVDPQAYVWQLSVGERQRVEIIKALYRDARCSILDEPTAVLTPQRGRRPVRHAPRRWSPTAAGLVFISHKISEVLALADRITVLRNGRVIGDGAAGAT